MGDTRTCWGRIDFAEGPPSAMAAAIPAGLILAAGVGAIVVLTHVTQGEKAMVIANVLTSLCRGLSAA